MKRIYNKSTLTSQFLSDQRIDLNKKYRPFFYLLEHKVHNGMLLYHTLTKELFLLNDEEYKQFLNPQNIESETIRDLIKGYFMVPNDFDDKNFMCQFLDMVDQLKKIYLSPKLTSLVIFTTSDCNARCFYCFERETRKISMNEKTAHDIADFIEKKCTNPVTIRWFGGEPLYNREVIDIILGDLRKKGIKYLSSMVSNGYLFDDDVIKKSTTDWNLVRVQITLDGTEKIYNRVKNYIYNDNISPFFKVLNNIENLLKSGIYVVLRLNMDEHNNDDLKDLTHQLVNRFSKYKNCKIYVKLLFEDTCNTIQFRTANRRHALMEQSLELQKFIDENMTTVIPQRVLYKQRDNFCMTDSDSTAMIFPDGRLGRCEHYTDDDFYGSIYTDEIDMKNIIDHKQLIKIVDECDNCKYCNLCRRPKCCKSGHPLRCDDYDKLLTKTRIEEKLDNIYNLFKANESKKSE